MKKLSILFFLLGTILFFSLGPIIPKDYNLLVYLIIFLLFIAGIYCTVSIDDDTE
ncbi:hypothetical protein JEODO184_00902 [Jeotgalicoccus meleagridis]|uniref:Uncharacterized protein n=1 Tax=Jeotgalicoccus meleagridis TaxID=2759181 RepID=A0A6V7RDN1_9STAP|nr:hypothetical protein JEODO184_00902 [Jeotgalicoccus meleagridis]